MDRAQYELTISKINHYEKLKQREKSIEDALFIFQNVAIKPEDADFTGITFHRTNLSGFGLANGILTDLEIRDALIPLLKVKLKDIQKEIEKL